MNFNLHFGELHSNNSINDKNNLFENYVPESYKVKRILISFNCFSEYICVLSYLFIVSIPDFFPLTYFVANKFWYRACFYYSSFSVDSVWTHSAVVVGLAEFGSVTAFRHNQIN